MLIIKIIEDYPGWRVSLRADDWRFREAIESLKIRIPQELREYVPERRQWLIYRAAERNLWNWRTYVEGQLQATIVTDPDSDPAGSRRQQYRAPREDESTDAYAVLFLRPGAPAELVRAARKILTRSHHPDAGGSHEAMVRINNAFDHIIGRTAA